METLLVGYRISIMCAVVLWVSISLKPKVLTSVPVHPESCLKSANNMTSTFRRSDTSVNLKSTSTCEEIWTTLYSQAGKYTFTSFVWYSKAIYVGFIYILFLPCINLKKYSRLMPHPEKSAKEAFCHKILAGVDLLPQIFAIAPKAEN